MESAKPIPSAPEGRGLKARKRVIFVAGADRSGSTLVGCILGSTRTPFEVFHIGEAHAFFKNGRRYADHRQATDMSPEAGKIWEKVNPELGYQTAYPQLFHLSRTRTLIDSSKTPSSLTEQIDVCEKLGYELLVVITFRPFDGIFSSDKKRNKDDEYCLKNLRRYRTLMKLLERHPIPFIVIDVEKLISSPRSETRRLCMATGIPYFSGKEEYWRYSHCHLSGATTQRDHILNPESAGYLVGKATPAMSHDSPLQAIPDLAILERKLKRLAKEARKGAIRLTQEKYSVKDDNQ
jgi:hypothetical protein